MEMIIKGKQLGFTLSEIHDLIGNYERDVEIEQKISSTDLLQRQRKEIDEFVARLAKSPDDITHVPEFGDLTEAREVLARVYSWAGGETDALFWYRAQPIPAFGDRTAESLVKSGQAAALRDYLDSIAVGGFA